ncbi:Transcription factor IIA alpha/beta subunit [Penicillium cf. griseofulvum]|nr:Transcription factor IIA alpha/beta subunit [Penicillium cf. griseofulvum]
MSNQQVGAVFEKVIQEVCDASQVDFEESGVDQQTLHDLRETWQHKLSSVNVAHFPWDPTPQPAQQHSVPLPTATVPSNAPRQPPPSSNMFLRLCPKLRPRTPCPWVGLASRPSQDLMANLECRT